MSGPAPTATGLVHLPDGRKLAYVEIGDPEGRPVFYFHGTPNSRLSIPDLPEDTGVRLISIDRPGYGMSDPKPGRTLLEWPDDVAFLAHELGFGRFAVLGISGGAPHAAACAFKIPEVISRAGIAACMYPPGVPFDSSGAMRKPIETDEEREANRARILERYKQMASGITDVLRAMLQTIPALDREILEPLLDRWMMAGREALRQGPQGYIDDSRVLASRWGFSVQDIEAPVIVFHGEADPMVPVAAGRWLARQIPDCRAIFYPDEGHHALLRHWKEALLALTE